MICRISFICSLLFCFVGFAQAQSLTVVKPIRLHSIIKIDDLTVLNPSAKSSVQNINQVVGLEAKRTLYPGQAVQIEDFGPVSVVDRNSLIQLVYSYGPLTITTEGRAMQRAGIGDRIRVMNSDSRLIVIGNVVSSTVVEVGK